MTVMSSVTERMLGNTSNMLRGGLMLETWENLQFP